MQLGEAKKARETSKTSNSDCFHRLQAAAKELPKKFKEEEDAMLAM